VLQDGRSLDFSVDLIRDSAVGIVTGYGLDDQRSEFEIWYAQEYSILHVVQKGSGAHPASYPMGTGGKAAGT
jgi:hypothetical protein